MSLVTSTTIAVDYINELTFGAGTTVNGVNFTGGYLQLSDIVAPINTVAGKGRLYKKTGDVGLFWKSDEKGVEVNIASVDLSQTALLAGRTGGQILNGGLLASETLTLKAGAAGLNTIVMSNGETNFNTNVVMGGNDIEGVNWITVEHVEFIGTSTTLGNNTFTNTNTNSLFCGASTGTNAAGIDNVGLGSAALSSLTVGGRSNTAVGVSAGNNITTGDRNVFLGKNTSGGSGTNTTGAVAIGHGATAASGQCVIGDNDYGLTDVLPGTTNYMSLGNDGQRWSRVVTADVKTPEISLIGTTSGEISIKAVAATTNYTLTLPPTVGVVGQVMENQGAGVVQWGVPNDVTKLPLAGGTMTGGLNMGSQAITNVASSAELTSFYEELVDAGTSAWSGPWAAAQTAPYALTRVGKCITMTVTGILAAAAVNTFITGPTLLARFRPAYNTEILVNIVDNSIVVTGNISIGSDGTTRIYSGPVGNFTASNNAGINGISMSWVSM